MKPSEALQKAINAEIKRDASFMDKCNFHQAMMDKFNKTGLSPMQLADTPEGQAKLDIINRQVSDAMVEKFGG